MPDARPASTRPPGSLAEPRGPVSAAGVGIPAVPETGLASWFPGVWVLRHYRRAWLARDIIAACVEFLGYDVWELAA